MKYYEKTFFAGGGVGGGLVFCFIFNDLTDRSLHRFPKLAS